jgi:prophage regulatory protein
LVFFVSFAMRAVHEARHMAKNILPLGEPPPTGYYRQSQLIPGIIPFSSATLWRKVKAGTFPAPVKLSERVTAWRAADVAAWMQARDDAGPAAPEESRDDAKQKVRAKPEAKSARRTSSGRNPAQKRDRADDVRG